MKKIKIKITVMMLGIICFYACSPVEQEEAEITPQLSKASFSNSKGGFCDDLQFSNLSSGPQQRCCINANFSFSGSNIPPGLVNYTLEFQAREGDSFGTVYEFDFVDIGNTNQILTFTINAIAETNGSVMGRWRIKAEDCNFTDWVDHFSFL